MKTLKQIPNNIRLWLVERLWTCQSMVRVMSGSLDQRLGPIDWIKVKLHLAVCKWCRRYLAQIRLISRLARPAAASAPVAKSATLSSAARQRMRAALAEAHKTDG